MCAPPAPDLLLFLFFSREKRGEGRKGAKSFIGNDCRKKRQCFITRPFSEEGGRKEFFAQFSDWLQTGSKSAWREWGMRRHTKNK